MRLKAFTLIELLIVVLIIAILAAIAVPNFLEFQTRAKISRVKADMRAVATAIEAYTVDNDRVPIGYVEGVHVDSKYQGNAFVDRYRVWELLTTPISYITTHMSDPFSTHEQVAGIGGTANRIDFSRFALQVFFKGHPGGTSYEIPESKANITWVTYSLGPERIEVPPWFENMVANPSGASGGRTGYGNIYDPTNGTVSQGKIYRTNKGILEAVHLTN